jgi:hypothetical protein
MTVALPGSTASGPARPITVGVGDFQGSLLRSPATWPAFVLSVYHGHYEELAEEAAQRRANIEGPVRLIEPLIDSSLGASIAARLSAEDRSSDGRARLLGLRRPDGFGEGVADAGAR